MTKPHRIPKPSSLARGAARGLACLLAAAACGGSGADGRTPEATLAESPDAARAYRRVDNRWDATPPHRRAALLPELTTFLEKHGGDPTARRVRLYRAWVYVERGELGRAAKEAAREGDEVGVDADLSTVVEAAVLTRRGRPQAALRLLLPLRGKIIDGEDRALYAAELVRAALEAKRYRDAVIYMLDFAEHASFAHAEDAKAAILDQVRLVPSAALEEAYDMLGASRDEPDSARAAARKWLRQTVRAQLVKHALGRKDVELARRLLDRIPSTLRLDDTREALRQLAARAGVDPRIEGRALGLVLEVFAPDARRRSADTAAGLSQGLGLSGSGQPMVRLVSREARALGDVGSALSGLAGDGAAILVAGMAPKSASAAARFAERSEIPVLLLSEPDEPVARDGYSFVLGEASRRQLEAIEAALDARGAMRRVVVGAASGVACDVQAPRAGAARFPVRDWDRAGVDTLVLLGAPPCATDVVSEVRDHGFSPTLVLGLETGAVDGQGLASVEGLSAGQFRGAGRSDGSWYGGLARDAASLGTASLEAFPLEHTQEDAAVKALHRRARDLMATVSVPLVTTDARGFDGGRRIRRTLRLVTLAGRP